MRIFIYHQVKHCLVLRLNDERFYQKVQSLSQMHCKAYAYMRTRLVEHRHVATIGKVTKNIFKSVRRVKTYVRFKYGESVSISIPM